MIVCNIFGGPGAGKSTLAADLFVRLKRLGKNVELVTEYAKDMVWEGRDSILQDQLYVVAKQNRRLDRLRGKVDIAITDSPILLCSVYSDASPHPASFKRLVKQVWDTYDNQSLLLHRPPTYSDVGRMQDLEGAKELDTKIKLMLSNLDVPVANVHTWDHPDFILNHKLNIL